MMDRACRGSHVVAPVSHRLIMLQIGFVFLVVIFVFVPHFSVHSPTFENAMLTHLSSDSVPARSPLSPPQFWSKGPCLRGFPTPAAPHVCSAHKTCKTRTRGYRLLLCCYSARSKTRYHKFRCKGTPVGKNRRGGERSDRASYGGQWGAKGIATCTRTLA